MESQRKRSSCEAGTLAYHHTVIDTYLSCEMGMILLFHQYYLQMQGMIRMNKAFIPCRASRKSFSFPRTFYGAKLPQVRGGDIISGDLSQC